MGEGRYDLNSGESRRASVKRLGLGFNVEPKCLEEGFGVNMLLPRGEECGAIKP